MDWYAFGEWLAAAPPLVERDTQHPTPPCWLTGGSVDLVINIPIDYDEVGRPDGYHIRRRAVLMLPAPAANAAPMTFIADLSAANEAPPPVVISSGTGLAAIVLDPTAHTLQVNATFSGLTSNTVAAHIHYCEPVGTNAVVATPQPAFPGFPLGVMSGNYSSIAFDLTQQSFYHSAVILHVPFFTGAGKTVQAAEAALMAGIENGLSYFNINTVNFVGGEIRGQLVSAPIVGAGLPVSCWRAALFSLGGDAVRKSPELPALASIRQPAIVEQSQFMTTRPKPVIVAGTPFSKPRVPSRPRLSFPRDISAAEDGSPSSRAEAPTPVAPGCFAQRSDEIRNLRDRHDALAAE
jgi:hypothetical protein